MPSLTEDYECMALQGATPGKKRRYEDSNEIQLQNANNHSIDSGFIHRKIHALPLKKRARTLDHNQGIHYGLPLTQRVATVHIPIAPTKAALAPCHICHRKPTRKSDLDSYADCQGCQRRTCYICIRECHGWKSEPDPTSPIHRSFDMIDADSPIQHDGIEQQHHMHSQKHMGNEDKKNAKGLEWVGSPLDHRAVICSDCCIETGPDGDVMCLGCLEWTDGGGSRNANHGH